MTIITDSEQTLVLSSSESTILVRSETTGVVISQEQEPIIVSSEETKTIYIGSPGPQGPPGQIGQVQFNTIAPSTQTTIVDSLSTSLFRGAKWILTAHDSVNNLTRYMEIAGIHSNSTPSHAIGPALGATSILAVTDVDVVIQSGNLNLTVTNNHTENLTISVARIKIDSVTL